MTSLAIFKTAPFTEAAIRELRHNKTFRAGFQLHGVRVVAGHRGRAGERQERSSSKASWVPASRQTDLAEALTLASGTPGRCCAPTAHALRLTHCPCTEQKEHCTKGASNTHGAQGSGPHASHTGNQLRAHTAIGSHFAKRYPK